MLFLFSADPIFSRPHISLCFTWGQAQGPESQISCCPWEGMVSVSSIMCSHWKPRRGRETPEGEIGKRRGGPGDPGLALPTSFRYCPGALLCPSLWTSSPAPAPPPAVFSCRCAWPCVQGKDKKDMTCELSRDNRLLPMGPLWCPLTWAGAQGHCGTCASPVPGKGSTSATWEAPQVLQNGPWPWVSENDPLRALLVATEQADTLQVQTEAQGSCRVTDLPWKLSTAGPKDPEDVLILTQVDICGFFGLCSNCKVKSPGETVFSLLLG